MPSVCGYVRQKLFRQKQGVRFKVVASEVERFPLDKDYFHGVGGDQIGVVARRVSRPEGIAIEQHHDAGAKPGHGEFPSRRSR